MVLGKDWSSSFTLLLLKSNSPLSFLLFLPPSYRQLGNRRRHLNISSGNTKCVHKARNFEEFLERPDMEALQGGGSFLVPAVRGLLIISHQLSCFMYKMTELTKRRACRILHAKKIRDTFILVADPDIFACISVRRKVKSFRFLQKNVETFQIIFWSPIQRTEKYITLLHYRETTTFEEINFQGQIFIRE